MKSDPPAPAVTQNLLRQQLILAQVRIMELEDIRDEQAPRLAALEKLLAAAQTLAERKADESIHLERVRADLQRQYEHLRHIQHVTNQALEENRAALAVANGREQNLLSKVEQLQTLITRQSDLAREQQAQLDALSFRLKSALTESADRLSRIETLDTEQRDLKASRSWRWTAWLRALERRWR